MSTHQSSVSSAVKTRGGLTAQDSRALRRLFEQVYSEGQLHVVEDTVSANYVGYCSGVGETFRGPSGVKTHATRLRTAFFDLRFDIDDISETSDGVEVRWTATGRLERAIMGIEPECIIGRAGEAPGGPEISVTGVSSLKMTDGKVRQSYMDWYLDEQRSQVENEASPA